jgi:hypothetical protein
MQLEKVHVRGVDELTTDDLKRFACDHFTIEPPTRIEWIDDTSANIIYSSEDIGVQALIALTQLSEEEDIASLPPSRLRTAKSLFTHPDSVLQVRSAVKTDRKKPRAHEASRFYLMHPEHDPREKLRHELDERRNQSRRRDDDDGDYNRRRLDENEHRRRRERVVNDGYSASMYDDNMDISTGERRSSLDGSDSEYRNRPRRGRRRDLFPEHAADSSGRLRARSASPGPVDAEGSGHRHARRRFRERSPLPVKSHKNEGKELFTSSRTEGNGAASRELFPNKTASSFMKKELFPKSSLSNHRRSDAFDAANETADLFSKKLALPLLDGSQDMPDVESGEQNTYGNGSGFSIRGAALNGLEATIRGSANGISIKGKSSVRELFPEKFNANVGKELFSDKLEGRGGQRRRAEDMFS